MTKEQKKVYDREYHVRNKAKKVAAAKAWAVANPEKMRERHAAWRRRNPEKCIAFTKAWRAKNKDRARGTYVLREYGLTPEQHLALLEVQHYTCAFEHCEAVVDLYSPVDHSHDTGKVRGVLCDRHNKGLGFFEKNAECLLDAHAYLKRTTP
jgi:hypothetical protein